ncbi:hypothetical protein FSARC_5521 [Fusarium sarcochroum]|uniref:Xylanolytic transcriptional activator regulatory domain-containing protein n=1 Tax=Fusarium sarcochroum TaxID=1208366 RepID=A0A8H4X9G0_9HYPO|nr:hypothetical protein FSARC_5521 [Fusarium sarcochroum]
MSQGARPADKQAQESPEVIVRQAIQSKKSDTNKKHPSNDAAMDNGMLIEFESSSNSSNERRILSPQMRVDKHLGSATDSMDYSMFTTLPTSPWLNERVREIPYVNQPSLSSMRPTGSSRTGMALGPFSLPTFHELPSKPVALELITDALKSFNTFFPIFDESDFMHKFHDQYLDSSPGNPSWWACINLVLALAHRFRSMRTYDTGYESTQAFGHIHNALAVVAELNIMHSNLAAVQALVGLAIVLQGTANPHPASVLTAAAIRLAQALGLHRQIPHDSLPKNEIEQGRRVFWHAYLLDKDISLRMRQPFAQDDEDMDAELPSDNLFQPPSLGGSNTTDLFRSRIGLAVIQGQVYKRLYSVQAARQSEIQRQEVAQELNSIIGYWKSGVDIDIEDGPMAPLQAPLKIEVLHLLILRFTYVSCLVMIDVHTPDTTNLLLDVSQMHGTYSIFERACVTESRKAAQLIHLIPHGDYAIVWLLLQSFFNIVETLLKNVEEYPASPQALPDLNLVKPFLKLINVLASEEKTCYRSEEAKRMRKSSNELWSRASEAVQSMDMEFEPDGLFQVS